MNTARLRLHADEHVALTAVALLGGGAVVGMTSFQAGDMPLAYLGVATAALALVLLLAGGWLDGLALIAVALPLPAIASTTDYRIAPVLGVTGIVVVAWILGRGSDPRDVMHGTMPTRRVAAFLGAVGLSAIFAQQHVIAIRELVNFGLFFGLLIVATDELAHRPARIRSLANIIAAVVGIAGLLAVLETLTLLPGRFPLAATGLNRATLGFGWPNELGMFFAVGIPFSVHAVIANRGQPGRLVALAGLTAALLGIAATFSRGSWLALLTGSVVLLLAGERRFVVRIWACAIGAVLLVNVLSGGVIAFRITDTATDPLVLQRAALTLTALLVFRAYPILGVGPGGFGETLDRFGPQVDWLWNYVGTAHNAYVDVAAEMGLIGLTAFVWLLAGMLWVMVRGARRASADPAVSTDERSLRRTLLWSFSAVCLVSFSAWPFAHGIGQLIMLVSAMAFALDQAGRCYREVR